MSERLGTMRSPIIAQDKSRVSVAELATAGSRTSLLPIWQNAGDRVNLSSRPTVSVPRSIPAGIYVGGAMSRARPDPPPLQPHWFQILLALADRDLHGLGVMHEVLDRTGGHMRLWPGMLYRNLDRLVNDGLVVEIDPPPPADPEVGRA